LLGIKIVRIPEYVKNAIGSRVAKFDVLRTFIVYYRHTVNPNGLLREHCEGRDKIDGDSRKRE